MLPQGSAQTPDALLALKCLAKHAPAGEQEVKILTKEQETDSKLFKDKVTGLDLDVVEKVGGLGDVVLRALWGR